MPCSFPFTGLGYDIDTSSFTSPTPTTAQSFEAQSTMEPKKTRASKPKSRTGCITYPDWNRTRRIKCDEAKPICNRCQKSGFHCDGYREPQARTRRPKPILLPKPKQLLMPKIPTITHLISPTSSIYDTEIEYLCFKTFQERAAAELSGYFDTNIWTRTILQICHLEEFARHAVVAIGALHMTMELMQSNVQSSPSSQISQTLGLAHHRVALLHYDRALKFMADLTNRNDALSLRYVLLSCLLTTCFETYIGNQDSALAAAQRGVEVLTESITNIEWCKPVEDLKRIQTRILDDNDNDLLSTFARLEASIIMFDTNRRVGRILKPKRLEKFPPTTPMPSSFGNVKEARLYVDVLVRKALIWRDANLQRANYANLDFGETDAEDKIAKMQRFSERARSEFQACIKAKAQWIESFLPLFETTRKFPGSKEYLGASILMIQYISSNIMTHLPGQNFETYYDKFHEDMTKLVNIASDLLELYPVTKSKKAIYTFDDGVVQGLFLVATRSRDTHLRRKAIRLLVEHPRREGLWDSLMAATVASWFVNEEEKGLAIGDFVPESARLRIVMLDPRLAERRVVVRCSVLIEGLQDRVELEDVVLTW